MPIDFLRCHYPLPLPEYQKYLFHTPDIIGKNWSFAITAEGRLARGAYRLEDNDKILYGLVDELYHGQLLFYCRHQSKLITFAAHFWEGQLTEIELFSSE